MKFYSKLLFIVIALNFSAAFGNEKKFDFTGSVETVFKRIESLEDWDQSLTLAAQYINKLEDADPKNRDLILGYEAYAILLHDYSLDTDYLDPAEKSLTFYKKAYQLAAQIIGSKSEEYLRNLYSAATAYFDMGLMEDSEKALELWREKSEEAGSPYDKYYNLSGWIAWQRKEIELATFYQRKYLDLVYQTADAPDEILGTANYSYGITLSFNFPP